MKRLIFFFFASLFFFSKIEAQTTPPCGFDIMHAKQMLADSNYRKSVQGLNDRWISKMTMPSSALLTYTSSGYVYEIPIVIHVLHTGGSVGSTYNPDSTQIAGMVSYLNKSYAAESPFRDTTTSATTGGGTRIPLKFVLAKRSPTGASTNGIIRINATTTLGSAYTTYGLNADLTSGVSVSDITGLSRWPPADYYNVYSVNKIDGNDLTVTGGIAGFAYFPGQPASDGMYVVASQMKTGTTTVSHEFGHAYGLYHTFQGDAGGTSCPSTSPSCSESGDLVCDTEPHKRSSIYTSPLWCPPTDANPCTGGASYNNVTHNIMDYTLCPPDRYTAGQRARILSTIDTFRTGYHSSFGLLAPTSSLTAATCTPTVSSPGLALGPFIVEFNDLKVWTGSAGMEGSNYVDHSYAQQTFVKRRETYNIKVTTETNAQNVKVFIDYNNDGDFADLGEEVYSHNYTVPLGHELHSGTITIPNTATTCTFLRMRVVSDFGGSSAPTACGPLTYGQAEDYAVYVRSDTAAVTSPIAYCQNATATGLTATGSNLKWYTADTGGTGTTAPTPLTTTVGSTIYYVSQSGDGSENCESDRTPITVVISALPTISGTLTVAVGGTSTLTGSGTAHPTSPWASSNTAMATVSSAGVVTGVAAGTVNIIYKNNSGCTDTASFVVTGSAVTAPSVITPIYYCQGTTASTLTATLSTATDTLYWYTGATGGTGTKTAPTPLTTTAGTTTYYVSEKSTGGLESSRTPLDVIIVPNKIFVDSSFATTTGTGASWASPYKTVSQALNYANRLTCAIEIWVKKGTYYPMSSLTTVATNRDSSFRILRNNIKVYGGFAGTETAVSGRTIASNPTILSGDIGTVADSTDNVYHVFTIFTPNGTGTIDTNTLLDGLILTKGNGYGAGGSFTASGYGLNQQDGGGLHFGAFSTGVCSPQIVNCTFTRNAANFGGGIYVNAWTTPSVSSFAIFTNCTFSNNTASVNGGGIFNNGNAYNIRQTFSNCTFSNNLAINAGGALFSYNSGLTISSSSFSNNTATNNAGGAMYNQSDSLTVSNTNFTGNKSTNNVGGAIFNTSSNGTFNNATFTNDSATNGGAINQSGGKWNYTNCSFTGNGAKNGNGGAINQASDVVTYSGCSFTSNVASSSGGAVYGNNDTLSFSNATITSNNANAASGGDGGAIVSANTSLLTVDASVFSYNSGTNCRGGAISGTGTASISNSQFSNNTALRGGAICNFGNSKLYTISNCTINNNSSTEFGGALCVLFGANLTVNNSKIENNFAQSSNGGGVLYSQNDGKIIFNNDTMTSNHSNTWGGAITLIFNNITPFITNCVFKSNRSAPSSSYSGGAIYLQNASMNISGSEFSRDTSNAGGAISSSNNTFLKCTRNFFENNVSTNAFGGAIYSTNTNDTFLNNVFYSNKDFGMTGGSALCITSTTGNNRLIANNTCFADTTLGAGTLFVNGSDGATSIYNNVFWQNRAGTAPDISNSTSGSAVVNVSNNLKNTDNPSFVNPTNPKGADNLWGTSDDGLRISTISPAFNTGLNSAIPTTITTDAALATRIQATTIDIGAYEGANLNCPSATRLYVDSSLVSSGDGSSWANAYKTVWEALTIANSCTSVNEIWVKKGTYFPMLNAITKATSRDSSLRILRNGIKIYGGFAGTETLLSARSVTTNTTILSGDIGTLNDSTDNSFHVMTIINTSSTAIDTTTTVDGFTINKAYANGGTFTYGTLITLINGDGGGILNVGNGTSTVCSPLIQNCNFTRNYANVGGAFYSRGSGGGTSNPTFRFCNFVQNYASDVAGLHSYSDGGGLSNPKVYYCIFKNNQASIGAACGAYSLTGGSSNPEYYNCVFEANTASNIGGAGYVYAGSISATNSVFVNNVNSGGSGGGAFGIGGGQTATFRSCTFSNNTTASTTNPNSNAILSSGTLNLTNTIVWGAATNQITATGTSTYSYSLVKGLGLSAPSLSVDPRFRNPTIPAGVDGIWLTADDGLELIPCSPAVNAGLATTPTTDIRNRSRFGGFTDMGAYEEQTGTLPSIPLVTTPISYCKNATALALTATKSSTSDTLKWYNKAMTLLTGAPTPSTTTVGNDTFYVSQTNIAGCESGKAMIVIIINSLPSISGTLNACIGKTSNLTGTATAHPTTPWASSNTAIATVSTTGVVSALSAGTTIITYKNTNGCDTSATFTVNPLPTITGTLVACMGKTSTLTGSATAHATTPWTSSNTAIATVSSTGVVTGVAAGTVTITYKNTNGCDQTASFLVNPLPSITGTLSACIGNTSTLTGSATAHATTPWASSNTAIATVSSGGLVTGIAAGTATITYKNTNGCDTSVTFTVNPLPTIGGTLNTCIGTSSTLTGSATAHATTPWASSNTTIATVSSGGVVTGIAAGTVTITYQNTNGCTQTATFTVNPLPTISGTLVACVGKTSTLTGSATAHATTPWTSSNTAIATVSSTGVVTGVSGGTVTITYRNTNGCTQTASFLVNPLPTITGTPNVCLGLTRTLTGSATPDASTPWTSSNTSIATVSSSGVVSGLATGTTTITYLNTNGCSQAITFTVNPNPLAPTVVSPLNLCIGSVAIPLTATGTNLKWYTVLSGGTGSSTAPTPSTAVVKDSNFYVSQTNTFGCEGPRATLVVSVKPLPIVSISSLAPSGFVFCRFGSITLKATAPTATLYQWSYNGTLKTGAIADTIVADTTGFYKVNVTDTYGCKNNDSVWAQRDTSKIPVLSPTSAQICAEGGQLFTVSPGFVTWRFNWISSGAPMIPPTPTTNLRNINTAGTYWVITTNSFGCFDTTNTASVSVLPSPTKPIIVVAKPLLQVPNSYRYYQWYRNSAKLIGANSYRYTTTTTGYYHVEVSDASGCINNSDTVLVQYTTNINVASINKELLKIYPNPSHDIVYIDAPIKVNVKVTDITGRLIIEQKDATQVNLTNFADGTYLLMVSDENNNVITVQKISKIE